MLLPSVFGESLFDDIFEDFAKPVRNNFRYHTPTTTVMKSDIRELEGGFELDIELPGYKKENVNAELKEGYLVITASNKSDTEEKDEQGRYIRRERYVGSCSRSFYVGEDITEEDIKAKFEDGILKVSIPKKEAKPQVEEKKYIAIEG